MEGVHNKCHTYSVQMTKGFRLGLDAEAGTFEVKLPVIVKYGDVDCNSGMSGRRAKEAMCQECYKNSALFAQFLYSFLTYVWLFYFICLHCANIHTPLPFLSYLYNFQNIKTRHSDLFCAEEYL